MALLCDVRLTAGRMGHSLLCALLALVRLYFGPHTSLLPPSPPRQDCGSFFFISPATQIVLTQMVTEPVQTSCKYFRSFMSEGIAMSREEKIKFHFRLVAHRGGPIRHSEIMDLML